MDIEEQLSAQRTIKSMRSILSPDHVPLSFDSDDSSSILSLYNGNLEAQPGIPEASNHARPRNRLTSFFSRRKTHVQPSQLAGAWPSHLRRYYGYFSEKPASSWIESLICCWAFSPTEPDGVTHGLKASSVHNDTTVSAYLDEHLGVWLDPVTSECLQVWYVTCGTVTCDDS